MKSLRDEIAHNADLVRPKRGDEAARARHRDLMLGRYSEGLTLQEIGDYFGITKERVRVLLLDASNRAHGLKLATTAFSRLTRAIAKSGALTANQLQQECQAILGAGGTIVGALTYADRMLKQPLGLEILTHRMGVDLVAGKGTENWIGDASRMAHQQVYQHGAVTVAAVTRHVNSLREIRLSNSETLGVLQELQGFDWLDESQQWFWFGPTHSRLAEWAVALLHIAERPMSAQEIHDALMRRQSMRFELALGQLPSVAAIDQHLSTADSLSRRQGKFRLIGEGGCRRMPRAWPAC